MARIHLRRSPARAPGRLASCVVVLGLLAACQSSASTAPTTSPEPAQSEPASPTSAVSVTPAPGSIAVQFHAASQTLVDQVSLLGYDCKELSGGVVCTYPGAGSLDVGEWGEVPYGVIIQGLDDLQGVGFLTDDRQRLADWITAVTSSQTADWALDRLDVLLSYAEAWTSIGETPDDGLPFCRTLDAAVVDLGVDFDEGTPILAAMLRPFDQPGSRPLPWLASQENCTDQPVLQPSASADSPCEEAVLEYLGTECCDEANHAAFEQVFATCTVAELEGFNDEATNDWREDWPMWVDMQCADAEHPETRLCQSRP
jgi:hypothetical protein